jgi:hypothetical protein
LSEGQAAPRRTWHDPWNILGEAEPECDFRDEKVNWNVARPVAKPAPYTLKTPMCKEQRNAEKAFWKKGAQEK